MSECARPLEHQQLCACTRTSQCRSWRQCERRYGQRPCNARSIRSSWQTNSLISIRPPSPFAGVASCSTQNACQSLPSTDESASRRGHINQVLRRMSTLAARLTCGPMAEPRRNVQPCVEMGQIAQLWRASCAGEPGSRRRACGRRRGRRRGRAGRERHGRGCQPSASARAVEYVPRHVSGITDSAPGGVWSQLISELAAAHGVRRSWIYKLPARYRDGGYEALQPRWRRPRSCKHETPCVLPDRTAGSATLPCGRVFQLVRRGFDGLRGFVDRCLDGLFRRLSAEAPVLRRQLHCGRLI
jgi:hypothetical protein